jgi:hypothetical protein
MRAGNPPPTAHINPDGSGGGDAEHDEQLVVGSSHGVPYLLHRQFDHLYVSGGEPRPLGPYGDQLPVELESRGLFRVLSEG